MASPTIMTDAAHSSSAGLSGTLDRPELADLIDRFDTIYRDAAGDSKQIPWARAKANPALVAWLNAEGPCLLRPGARVVVVGCGLGHDACELADRGYDVTAFDICANAIDWAQRLHPRHADCFMQADLFDLPARLHHRFDLVVDVHTLQALPPEYRAEIGRSMGAMLSHRGIVVSIARGRESSIPLESIDGPPFELTPEELIQSMAEAGLHPVRDIDDFLDDNSPPVRRLRGIFARR